MKTPSFILVLSILLAILTRFYLLGRVPAGLYVDEAAQGYNAYSILKTGKDEFGMPFPIAFRSFADFKTPVYIYLLVPLIPVFGLSAFTVRLPSFIASILTIPLLYFLILKLGKKLKTAPLLAALSSLTLAISPWHLLFGRADFEANIALFLYLLSIYLFYLGLKKPRFLLFSGLVFAFALPAYHSQRILVPLTLIYFFFRFRKTLFSPLFRRFSAAALLLGLVISLPTLSIIATPGFLARLNTLNIGQNLPGQITGLSGAVSALVNFPLYLRLKEFLSLYLSYFSPRHLFFLGDANPRLAFPQLSTFFFWQFPFYLHGFYLILKKKDYSELKKLTLFIFLLGPLPAALARDPFSTIRSLPLVIPISVLIAVSLVHLWPKARLLLFVLVIFSFLKITSSAFVLNEKINALSWDYGWQSVLQILKNATDTSLPVVIDNARGEPYIQTLFYTQFDPAEYQKENFEVSKAEYYTDLNRVKDKKIGRFEIRAINWAPDLNKNQYLVGDYLAISKRQIEENHLKLIAEIKYPDGSVAFRIVQTQPQSIRATIK